MTPLEMRVDAEYRKVVESLPQEYRELMFEPYGSFRVPQASSGQTQLFFLFNPRDGRTTDVGVLYAPTTQ